ncbi:hypothetical protein B0T26DRAFT_758000 [Lasiosphaeria miniovina]|uniref:Protein kinase domain-containing protein n=1 Tax=Lasiosphaeria miniovina TaxID=1954250 RepID=A0AA39ZR19_9PEZI|nr:uncharacterized protein B0T26DRAFT_758000 [Lasiosphaeria miniovina]KAK0702041.1 hypothetical protein B0T26DRAFT_758000 [Lasiosphaeria miniovina]
MSRQYDIWSMGCLILEIFVGLAHGYKGVKNIRSDVQGEHRGPKPCYTVEESPRREATGKLKDVVETWMDYLAEGPACDGRTALGQLLDLVRKRLLVVELPPHEAADKEPTRLQRYRATSAELAAALGRIMDDSNCSEHYWLNPKVDIRPAPRFNREDFQGPWGSLESLYPGFGGALGNSKSI